MSEFKYEFSDNRNGIRQPTDFNTNSTKTFDFDIAFEEPQGAVHISNKKISAGYFSLMQSRANGYSRTKVLRSWEHIRRDPSDVYVLRIPIRGSMSLEQFGQHAEVAESQIGVSYANAPFQLEIQPNINHEYLLLQAYVPTQVMHSLIGDPTRICGTQIRTVSGAGCMAKIILLNLFNEWEALSEELALTSFSTALHAFAETVSVRNGITEGSVCLQNRKLKSVLNYIELHTSDCKLTAAKVAAACGISTRYVHHLLKNNNKSFHDLLWERRLAQADLQIKTNESLSIAEIASATGFKSRSHFSRMFRERFGTSPRDARSSAVRNGKSS